MNSGVRMDTSVFGNGVFVIAGADGVIGRSADGITWTEREGNTDRTLLTAAGGNGIYITAGFNGTIVTSTEGIIWTLRASSAGVRGMAAGNNTIVAVLTSEDILISIDGVTWMRQTSETASVVGLNAVTFGNNLFVAVGNSGTVITSSNGVSWTDQSTPVTVHKPAVLFVYRHQVTFLVLLPLRLQENMLYQAPQT